METNAIQERVLGLFARYRVDPTAPFEEDHFLDYFLRNPANKRHLTTNSFAGLRRRNSFIDAVEIEFLVCFRTKDFDRNFSLPAFVDRISEQQTSLRSSREALRTRRRVSGWDASAVIILVLLTLAVAVLASSWLVKGILVLAAFGGGWIADGAVRTALHNRRLGRLFKEAHPAQKSP